MATPAGVSVSLKVDWSGNGFATGAYDDVTPDLKGGSGTEGGSPVGSKGGAGATATFLLRDLTARYWPDNAASVIYGLVKPGRKVRATVTYSGTTYPLFAGFLRRVSPAVGPDGVPTVTLVCEDHLAYHRRRKASVALAAWRSGGTFRQAVLDDLGITSGFRDLTAAPEDDVVPYSYASREAALDLLDELNEATLTRHYVVAGPDETTWYQYVARDRHYKLDAALDDTWTVGDLTAISGLDLDYDGVVNEQTVDGSPYVIQPAQVVWSWPRVPFMLASGASRTVFARFGQFVFPIGALAKYGVASGRQDRPPSRPAVSTDLQASVIATGSTSAVVTGYGTHAKVVLTNTAGVDITVVDVSVSGQPVLAVELQDVVREDAASQADYGVRSGATITSRFIANEAQAEAVGDHLLFRYGQPMKRPRIAMRNRFPEAVNRRLYDVVGVTCADAYLSARRFEIIGRTWRFAPDATWDTVYTLRESPEQSPTDFFDWGDTLPTSPPSSRLGY